MDENRGYQLEAINDFEIATSTRSALKNLLNSSFPGLFEQREYFKQVPKFRYLVWHYDSLIAQMGIEDRVINLGETPVRILGVIDLCVKKEYQSQSIATHLLLKLETLGRRYGFGFIILFADDHRLYEKNGYKIVRNMCRWLAIEEHQSVTILERELSDCFMVKSIGNKKWFEDVEVDLLGYLF